MKIKTIFNICIIMAILCFPSMVMGVTPVPWNSEDYYANTNVFFELCDYYDPYNCYYWGDDFDEVYGPPLPINASAFADGSYSDEWIYSSYMSSDATSDITDSYMEFETFVHADLDYDETHDPFNAASGGTVTARFTGTYDADLPFIQFSYSYDSSFNSKTAYFKVDDLTVIPSVTIFEQTYIDDGSLDSGSGFFSVPVDDGHEIQVEFAVTGSSYIFVCPGNRSRSDYLMLYYDTAANDCAELSVFNSPDYYLNLQNAYDVAEDADDILSQVGVINGDLYIDRDEAEISSVTFAGGYDCGHSTVIGKTVINGDLIVSRGTVYIGDFIIGI